MSLQKHLNNLAGTSELEAQGAANVLAGTTQLDLVGALNAAAGTFHIDLNGVVKVLADLYGGDSSLDANGALANATASPVSPTSIPQLQVWLKADDLSLIDNAAVASWVDAQNGLDFIQATGIKQPIFKSNVINGHDAVLFDGVDDTLSATSTLLATAQRTVCMVYQSAVEGVAAIGGLIGMNGVNWYFGMDTAERLRHNYQNSVPSTLTKTSSGISVTTQYSIFTLIVNVTGSDVRTRIRVNGGSVLDTTDSTGMTISSGTAIRIGSITSSANFVNGSIPELCAWDTALTDLQVNDIERYMSERYGVSLL